jgi:hypothetical protein
MNACTNTYSPEKAKFNYLEGRLYNTVSKLDNELRKQFGLVDDEFPTSPKELAERLKAGKYVVRYLHEDGNPGEYDDYINRYEPLGGLIRFRDPAVKEDQDGYSAAREEMLTVKKSVEDTLYIDTPENALKAIQEFENWKPAGKAN